MGNGMYIICACTTEQRHKQHKPVKITYFACQNIELATITP